MALDRLVSMILRAAELVFAAIVAGVNGDYLRHSNGSSWANGRFIYTEVVAGISIVFAVIWLIPFSSTFIHWPMDIILSILWWVAFGLLVDRIGNNCGGVFNWTNIAIRRNYPCGRFKTMIAFAFLSALLWLVSALIGFFWVRNRERRAARAEAAHANRRRGRWFRRSYV